MDNEGVAFGDIFKIIFEENTTIIHYQLSIIHSRVSTQNGNLRDGNISYLISRIFLKKGEDKREFLCYTIRNHPLFTCL